MSDDLKAQIGITANADGVEAGVQGAKRALNELGASASAAGAQASKGIADIGSGGDAATLSIDETVTTGRIAVPTTMAVTVDATGSVSTTWLYQFIGF
jgi:hypothetical protein